MRGSLRPIRPGSWELRVPLPAEPATGRRRQRSVTFHGNKREATREFVRLVAETDAGRATGSRTTVADLLER